MRITGRQRLGALILIIAGVAAIVGGAGATLLYHQSLAEHRGRLVELAQSQARLIEAVARFDAQYSVHDHPDGPAAATLTQIEDAHRAYVGFGNTGEFTLARREGDRIVFLVTHRHGSSCPLGPVPFDSDRAEPMRQALLGHSGTLVGQDYRGEVVLAAYEPVRGTNWGIVAKIDLDEIRAPFVLTAVQFGLVTFAAVVAGALLFVRITDPLIRKLRESNQKYSSLVNQSPDPILAVERSGRILSANPAAELILGSPERQLIGRHFTDIGALSGASLSKAQSEFQQLVSGEDRLPFELTLTPPGDMPVTVEVNSRPIRDAHGVVGVHATLRNITGRKLMEEALRESERELAVRNAIAQACLTIADDDMYGEVLSIILEVTQSQFGVFGYIDEDGALVVPSMPQHVREAYHIPDEKIVLPRHEWGDRFWLQAIQRKKALHSNEPSMLTPLASVAIRRNVTVPIVYRGEVAGLLQAANKDTDYDHRDIRLLETVASAVAPILRTRLEKAAQERERKRAEEEIQTLSRHQSVLNSLLRVGLEDIPLKATLERCLDEILSFDWLPVLRQGGIFLIEEDPDVLVLRAQRNLAPAIQTACARVPLGHCLCGRAAVNGKLEFADRVDDRHDVRYPDMTAHGHYVVPIRLRDKVLGVLGLYLQEGHQQNEAQEALLEAVGYTLAGIVTRKQAEESLRRQKDLLGKIIANVPYSVFWKDRKAIYLGCNDNFAREAGVPRPEDIVGKTDYDLAWKKEEADWYRRCDLAVMQHGEPLLGIEEPQLRADGTEATLLTSKVPLRDAEGQVVGILGIYADITERKQAEAERFRHLQIEQERNHLRDAVRALERVLGVVGHELRTPLAGMRAMAELLLQEEIRETAELDSFVRSIHDEIIRMSGMVNDLLEVARLNSETARWNWAEVRVTEACQAAVSSVKPLIDATKVKLLLEVSPPDLVLNGDVDAIRRLVLNLLSNATKHTTEGSIDVRATGKTRDQHEWVELKVCDTGEGMPPEIARRLGVAFALNSGVVGESHVTGSGLGLAICRGIVAAHGGSISVETAQGAGTAVTVLLRADLPQPVPVEDAAHIVCEVLQ